jgi:hypothetical protein
MSDLTDRFAMSMYASRADRDEAMIAEIDRLTAERDALREQLTLAESVRAAQVAGLTEGAEKLRERVAALTKLVDASEGGVDVDGVNWFDLREAARAALKGER